MKAPAVPKSVSLTSKTILICSVSLLFAAAGPAAFAQRGGGGGGSHGGGGHAAGGAHVSSAHGYMGSAGRGSAGASSRGFGSRVVSASGSSTRGFTHNTFVPPPGERASSASYLRVGASTPFASRTLAANNYIWEAPPQRTGAMSTAARPGYAPPMRPFTPPATARMSGAFASPRLLTGTASNLRPRPQGTAAAGMIPVFPRFAFRPTTFGTPFFNPALGPFNFGFGFGRPCFFSSFGFCRSGIGPFGGFGPFGIGFGGFGFGLFDWDWGLGYGYGNGYFYPPAEEPPPPPENPTEENVPPDYATEYWFVPPPDEAAAPAPQQPVVKLALKDGTIFDVYSYWLENGRLHYVTTYNIQTSIPIDELDLQQTVDLNYKLGITFTLTPKPQGATPHPPDSQPQDQP
jgi:hypothetical protein